MNFLDNIENDILIICNNYSKNTILEFLNNNNKLLNINIITINEFYNYYFFSYDEKTIYYLKDKYNISISNSKMYLDNMKYIINSNINNDKIIYLKELYNDLLNNNLLIIDKYFKNTLKNKNIIVLDEDSIDLFTKNILNQYNTKYIYLYSNNNLDKIYSFSSIDLEIEYVVNKISELIKNNININDIKVCLLGTEYISGFKRFSSLYKILFKNIEKNSIISSIESKNFLNIIKNSNKEEIYNKIKDYQNNKIFINIINKYYFIDDLNLVYDEIEYDLKNCFLEESNEGIEIVNFDDLVWHKDKYVFVLGFNLENIPKIYKDIDYFNDDLKKKLGIFTSFEKNKYSYNKTINILKSLNHLTLSYKIKDPYKSYYKSNLIEELNLKEESIILENNTSNLYNKIKLTNYLDLMIKYGDYNNLVDKLYNTYKDINYLTYSNKYNKIDNTNNSINLSYTSLNTYYHCAFKYYIDYILKLNIFEESFSMHLGTLFHFVLSEMFNKNFNFDSSWNKGLEKFEFNKKEEFYLVELKSELKKIIDVINYQHKLSGLTYLKLETDINLEIDNNKFTGIIDKIMFKEKDNNTYITIIDYKTGHPSINMKNLKYGLDMQLPIYVYLVNKSNIFHNPKIIGFYLEQILFEKNSYDSKKDENEQRKDKLKLNGFSIDDQYLVSMFDETYENSELIKGMKTTSKGFSVYTKVMSENDINNMTNLVDDKIKEAFNKIKDNDFTINPKVINGENVGCSFCKYKDLCFKTGSDLVYLKD